MKHWQKLKKSERYFSLRFFFFFFAMLLDSRYFAPFMISAERLGQLNSHVISNTLKELDAALTSPEVPMKKSLW